MKSILSKYERVIIASYRLPFKITIVDGVPKLIQNSGGLVSAIASLSDKIKYADGNEEKKHIVWVGKGEQEEMKLGYSEAGEGTFAIEPVIIDDEINEGFYAGFSNKLIWPLFHYFQNYAIYDNSFFDAYIKAQKLYCEKIMSIAKPNDFIWVHDYQLMLLSGMLREELPDASIGFFLHIPFPAFETFRMIKRPWREAILNGILGADLVGFQINDYTQYFLRSVSRTLGYEVRSGTVNAEGRIVKVDAFPIGIDYKKFENAARSMDVEREMVKMKEKLQGIKLISSVDRLDYTKGFINRLESFELFLEMFPQWHEKVVFNMIVIPSRDTIGSYQEMKKEIEALVGRINGKFSNLIWRPVIYQYHSIPFNELVALYCLSDVALITPLRDGMNLVCKEYTASQIQMNGVLILSEMAGAADELSDAILINPIDNNEIALSIHRALRLPQRERIIRMSHMQKRLRNYDVFSWAQDSMDSLEKVKRDQKMRQIEVMDENTEKTIMKTYNNAINRIIFLDYDGTLVPFSRFPDLAIPSETTIDLIRRLADDNKNMVVIISGRVSSFLEEHFGALNVYLVSEHGAFIKKPGETWVAETDDDQQWKKPIFPIFQRYCDHCGGSFIEEKATSLAWHYRNAEAELAATKTTQLREELRSVTANNPRLYLMDGHKVIEARRAGYDKGSAALNFIRSQVYDFIMAIGDDKTDEDIFRILPQNAFSIKVGMVNTMAKYNLKSQRHVSELIGKLIG